jgi:aerobic-type carbon monoxide dehydrogenase small subunit (CoxS/CutS family)
MDKMKIAYNMHILHVCMHQGEILHQSYCTSGRILFFSNLFTQREGKTNRACMRFQERSKRREQFMIE